MEDPLFEPWSVGAPEPVPPRGPDIEGEGSEPTAGTDRPRSARWRMPGRARLLPEPIVRLPLAGRRAAGDQPDEPDAPAEGRRGPDGDGRSASPLRTTHPDGVRALLALRAGETAARLREAGHRVRLDDCTDDRTGDSRATVRLRLVPWRAPFDEPGPRGGSALEIELDGREGGGGGEVIVRTWLDAPAATPTREVRIEIAKVDEAFVRSTLLDFVGAVLDRT